MLPCRGGFTVLTFASEPMKHEIDQNQCGALNCQSSVSDGLFPVRDMRVTSQVWTQGNWGNEREKDSDTIRSEMCVTVLKPGCYIKPVSTENELRLKKEVYGRSFETTKK